MNLTEKAKGCILAVMVFAEFMGGAALAIYGGYMIYVGIIAAPEWIKTVLLGILAAVCGAITALMLPEITMEVID